MQFCHPSGGARRPETTISQNRTSGPGGVIAAGYAVIKELPVSMLPHLCGDLHLEWIGKAESDLQRGASGFAIVRHICAVGLLSFPRPSFGCLKWRPMISENFAGSTMWFGSNE